MKEYIDRKKINSIFDKVCSNEVLRKQIAHYINAMPLEDVRENIRGRWIGRVNMFDGNTYFYCSKCGEESKDAYSWKGFQKYCPWCGTEMSGE